MQSKNKNDKLVDNCRNIDCDSLRFAIFDELLHYHRKPITGTSIAFQYINVIEKMTNCVGRVGDWLKKFEINHRVVSFEY